MKASMDAGGAQMLLPGHGGCGGGGAICCVKLRVAPGAELCAGSRLSRVPEAASTPSPKRADVRLQLAEDGHFRPPLLHHSSLDLALLQPFWLP
ncbi:hypothetical protein NDU88_012877 [Pleurodeles waltl]|uniref:Uncharacterized protein n=1 Tax=Pleurodeles waltl TaxID=8319 RepID=A0AAV7R4H6_PLEWA|nr:hypothetical protein NDU88_012877 [Pleurodeles waltl]